MSTYACRHCLEDITDDDAVPLNEGSSFVHRDCMVRMCVGSVGHQLGLCSCHGGDYEDPPAMTVRQAAQAAARVFRWQNTPYHPLDPFDVPEEQP